MNSVTPDYDTFSKDRIIHLGPCQNRIPYKNAAIPKHCIIIRKRAANALKSDQELPDTILHTAITPDQTLRTSFHHHQHISVTNQKEEKTSETSSTN